MMQIYCYLTILQIEITFLYRHMTIFNFLSKLMDTLIDRIKMIIEAKGYSPRAFAIAIGFNYSTLNNYLTGRRSTIDSELIEKALTSFDDITAEWLLRGKGDILIQKEETEPGMDKLKSIVYTIANLQDEINEKTVLTQRLLEENQKLKGELAMLKNERNVG